MKKMQAEYLLVATGRGPLAELFTRNAERSVYTTPQRKLVMVIVTSSGALNEPRLGSVGGFWP